MPQYNFGMMRTRLAVLILTVAAVPIYGQQESSKSAGGQKQFNGANTLSQMPAANNQRTVQQDGTIAERYSAQIETQNYLVRLFSAENLPNILLVVVGVGGILVAVRTLSKIERQIRVAEKGTQAMIRSERAWIVVSIESPEPNKFDFRATNVGKTPARIKSIWSAPVSFYRDEQMKIPPDEQTGESQMNTPPCLLPPTASQIVFRFNLGEFGAGPAATPEGFSRTQNDIRKGFRSLHFYGRIIYSNTLEEGPDHETKWLYWFVPIEGATPFPDPRHPEHNSYT